MKQQKVGNESQGCYYDERCRRRNKDAGVRAVWLEVVFGLVVQLAVAVMAAMQGRCSNKPTDSLNTTHQRQRGQRQR